MSIPLYLMRFLCSSITSRSPSCDILCVTVFSSNVANWWLLFIIVSSIVWFPWRKRGLSGRCCVYSFLVSFLISSFTMFQARPLIVVSPFLVVCFNPVVSRLLILFLIFSSSSIISSFDMFGVFVRVYF